MDYFNSSIGISVRISSDVFRETFSKIGLLGDPPSESGSTVSDITVVHMGKII